MPPRPRVLLADDHARLREAGTFAYLGKATMARRLHRGPAGAAARAVLATR
jgi:hypothetical protein